MTDIDAQIPNLEWFFTTFMHQDWTIHGESLAEIFENLGGLQGVSETLRIEVRTLIDQGHSHQWLDDLFYGRWLAGYEPNEDEGGTWTDVLHQIEELCSLYERKQCNGDRNIETT